MGIMTLLGSPITLSLVLLPVALLAIAAACIWRTRVGDLRLTSAMVGGLGGGVPLAFGTYMAVDFMVNFCIFDCGPPNTALPLFAGFVAFLTCGATAALATACTPRIPRDPLPLPELPPDP